MRGHGLRRQQQTVTLQAKVLHHALRQSMQQMRAARYAKARRKAARHRSAAHLFARFEHQHFATGARQVQGAGQAVVAGTDHDGIKTRSHACPRSPKSCNTERAALAPGAPMTPPPGCVLEPHIYKPLTGERYCA